MHVVPDVPIQDVGVVAHRRYRFEQVAHHLEVSIADALCAKQYVFNDIASGYKWPQSELPF